MNDKSRRRLELETKLRHAVEQNQIRVYYQPQVNINTNAVLGFEALVRWDHPEYGILPPAKFLSIAEDTGMILPIGDWLLAAACKQVVLWEKSGLGRFRLAVNLSTRQLTQSELVNKIKTVLTETQLPANRLCLEVKESAVMKDSAATLKILNELKMLGVCLVIDDFGVGHSSMNQLQSLPIDAITVDRSFVMNIAGRERDGIGAKAIIGLAKNLGLHVTAEGVETEAQVEFLRHYQCEEVQGHFYSPPIPAQQVSQFVTSMTELRRTASEPI
jgi:EAL domain-containing protein (putative c-di-GMP-specific phosphodiesterase class I)